jgi:HPt (histidine-containing phosphotransfer) domain-containing protein
MIDLERLSALRSDIGEEDFADVAHLFVSEIRERLDLLRSDPAAAHADDFHFLRGSAANLGFTAMVEACHAAERACRNGQPPDITAVMDAFVATLAAAVPNLPGIASAA